MCVDNPMFLARSSGDPYGSLTPDEAKILKLQLERWMRDQLKHDWSDLWNIQDQTAGLKNELLLGHGDAPVLESATIPAGDARNDWSWISRKLKHSPCCRSNARKAVSGYSDAGNFNVSLGSKGALQMFTQGW